MSDLPTIPDPTDSGNAGIQIEGDCQRIPAIETAPATSSSLVAAVQGIAASSSKSLGGFVGTKLIAGSFAYISNELLTTKEQLILTQAKLETCQTDLAKAKTNLAVVQERFEAWGRIRHFSNIGITLGSILVGTSIEFHRNGHSEYALASLLIGISLILIAWFAPSPKQEQ